MTTNSDTFMEFFELSLDMLCVLGSDGYFQHINPIWESKLGFSIAELKAKPFVEFVHPDDRQHTQAEIVQLTNGLDTIFFDNRYLRKNGSPLWLNWTATFSQSKQVIYAIARDVSEEKRVELLLNEFIEQTEILYDLSCRLNQTRDEDAILQAMMTSFRDNQADGMTLMYIDLDEQQQPMWLRPVASWQREGAVASPIGVRYYLPDYPFADLLLRTPTETLFVDDILIDPRLDENSREIFQLFGTRSFISLPLYQGEQWLGVITMNWRTLHPFSDYEQSIYQSMPPMLTATVSSRRLYMAQKNARQRSDQLYQLSCDLNIAKDEAIILEVLSRPAIQAGATRAVLFYTDAIHGSEIRWVEEVANWHKPGREAPDPPVGTRFDLQEWPLIHQWFSQPDKIQQVVNIATDKTIDDNFREFQLTYQRHALVMVPLTQGELWYGALLFQWPEPYSFHPTEISMYEAIAALATPTVKNRRLLLELEERVTERTAALLKSQNLAQETFAHVNLGIARVTVQGQFQWLNSTFVTMMGYSEDELLTMTIKEVSHPDDLSATGQFLKQLMQGGSNPQYMIEKRYIRGDTSIFWGRTTVNVVRDDDGKPNHLIAVIDDIDAEKQAQLEAKRLQEEVMAAQERLIQELSAPIIPLMDGIIVMPLIGSVDSARARDLTRTLLRGISQHRAKIVILDITGVSLVDTNIAGNLDKTIQAARLKGARTIVTGMSDAVAETIVDLGINWHNVETLRDMQTGLKIAIQMLDVTKRPHPINFTKNKEL